VCEHLEKHFSHAWKLARIADEVVHLIERLLDVLASSSM